MKFKVGDIVKFGHSVSDASLRTKVGRISNVVDYGGGVFDYSVDTFIPHPINHCTHFTGANESELIFLERPIDILAEGDKIQLDENWYVVSIVSASTVEIGNYELEGTIRVNRKYVRKVD